MYLNDQIKALNDQMARANERVSAVQSAQESIDRRASSSAGSDVAALRKELKAELLSLKAEIMDLSGKVEDNRTIVKRAVERDTTGEDTSKAGLIDLTNRVAKLEAKIAEMESRQGASTVSPAKKVSSQVSGVANEGARAVATPQQAPDGVKVDPAEKKAYDDAYSLYKRKMYKEAIASFKSFTVKYPSSSLGDNAHFWLGESYFGAKEYERAILAYQEVIKKYPNGNKVPNAMLHQAFAFSEIKDSVSAKVLLRRLIEKYPTSSEASIAKRKLQTIK
ncbi:MAG: tol-pal system protein YbgF [Desulfobacteraceae bacterium CG2_30_51_40]|nr:MAG: tol-pal system protein YbgF [Desulfobacteraceae bacterium CG2_30_51_40]